MADAIISVVVERAAVIIEEQIRNEVNLVRGVKKEVRNLSRELQTIRNVLDDAEQRGFKEKNIKDWLKRLEDTSYEVDDVLDEWYVAILKIALRKQKVSPSILSSCLCFKSVAVRRDIAKKIKDVKEKFDLILAEKDRYNFVMSQPTTYPSPKSWRVQSTSLVNTAEVHGRDPDKEILVSKLRPEGGSEEELSLQIVAIVGVGGVGKTTLTQLAYIDSRVREYFELRIWICVSDPFDVDGISRAIVESVRKGSCPDTNQLDMILQHLREIISGKRFLLVLDDVWTEDYTKWEPLKNSLIQCGGAGSKVLVTTRNERVAKMMGTTEKEIYRLKQLSNEDCLLVLRHMALLGRNEEEFEIFQEVGRKIAKKCKGLPLAAKVLGSLLRFKNSLEEWENVLNSEIWQLEEAKVELFPHLLLSYNELSPALKRCFSYCAIFPKDHEIQVEILIGNWIALGYLGSNIESAGDMVLKGQEYFQKLAMCSFFQELVVSSGDGQIESCKMHDIVHDFAQSLRKDRTNGRLEATMKKTHQSCSPLLVSHVKEFRGLFWNDEPPLSLCDCLTSLRALSLSECTLQSIPQGMENFIHLRWLDFSGNDLSGGDLKTICELYNLQTLNLENCQLREIPREIGNLIHLIHLNLSGNFEFEELPESICDLHELRTLDVQWCNNLRGLPQGINKLINLKHLRNQWTESLVQFPKGLDQLTGLRTLTRFHGGSHCNKLRLLKNLKLLSGYLELRLRLDDNSEDVAEDAREAELKKKIHIQKLRITFETDAKEEEESVMMNVMDALEPHPNLQALILEYKGSKLPAWISSPLNHLKEILLYECGRLSSLPPLGKLPCLEEICFVELTALQFVGREFLGIVTTSVGEENMKDIESSASSSSVAATANTSTTVAFPKLKTLIFSHCWNWKEWEDITPEEEASEAVSFMPCLTGLRIINCNGLTALPHRLLLKASSLEQLDFPRSEHLQQRYGGAFWEGGVFPWSVDTHQ